MKQCKNITCFSEVYYYYCYNQAYILCVSGNKGEKGLLGFPGQKGFPGPPGQLGDQGDLGEKGYTGLQGKNAATSSHFLSFILQMIICYLLLILA